MLVGVDENIISLLSHIGAGAFEKEEEKLKKTMQQAQMISSQDESANAGQEATSSKFGRNDIVKIEKDGEEREVKWKKAEEMLNDGWVLKS